MRQVYFIAGGGFTKVGLSNNPAQRLVNLDSASPRPLRLVLVLPGSAALERAVYEEMSDRHVRGEWFADEVAELEAHEIVERARARIGQRVRARDKLPVNRPRCECHGLPMYWSSDPRRRGGGYFRCAVRHRSRS